MKQPFDPGPVAEPFRSLAADYPGPDVYPAEDFRVEWGPIFHRGRLDGTARILVVGQDPGQHESIARRILVGEAGQRTQGFLHKLGIDRSYAMVNAFLYSVYGQAGGERHLADPAIAAYRNKWLDALVAGSLVEAVVSFGHLGREAFEEWRNTPAGQAVKVEFMPLTHPTMPEASSKGDPAKEAEAMARMLAQWNQALKELDQKLTQRDSDVDLALYGNDLKPEDRAPIPSFDLPAGSPPWMSSLKQWATRKGATPDEKRATVEVTIPPGERPWQHQ